MLVVMQSGPLLAFLICQYTQLHDHTWDEVMARMAKSNMRNFVVYYHEETGLMFHHFEVSPLIYSHLLISPHRLDLLLAVHPTT